MEENTDGSQIAEVSSFRSPKRHELAFEREKFSRATIRSVAIRSSARTLLSY